MLFLDHLIKFFGNIKFIIENFNAKINKIIRVSVMPKNFFVVNYLIMKFFIRETQFKTSKYFNVLTKLCLYDTCKKLSKLVNTLQKVGFLKTEVVSWLFSLQILMSENEKLLFFSTSKVNLMLGCWWFIKWIKNYKDVINISFVNDR